MSIDWSFHPFLEKDATILKALKLALPATKAGSAKRGSPRLTSAWRSNRAIRAAFSNFRLKQLVFYWRLNGLGRKLIKRASPANQLGSAKRGFPRLTSALRSHRAIRAAFSNFRLKQLVFYLRSWVVSC